MMLSKNLKVPKNITCSVVFTYTYIQSIDSPEQFPNESGGKNFLSNIVIVFCLIEFDS